MVRPGPAGTPRVAARTARVNAVAGVPELSVVVPVFNERDNVAPLVGEIVAALRGVVAFEIVYVDDHSKDDSFEVLRGLMADRKSVV